MSSTCTFGLGAIAFLLAEAIPIFNYLLALTGSVCFAPLALVLPMILWFHGHSDWIHGDFKKKLIYGLHVLIVLVGAFLSVGGTYSTIKLIVDFYATNPIGTYHFVSLCKLPANGLP